MIKSFYITNSLTNIPITVVDKIILIEDNWNDFGYYTLFGIKYITDKRTIKDIGSVRIAYFGQKTGISQKTLKLQETFQNLSDDYFSLGTDDTYYENLNKLGEDIRNRVLHGLNDIAYKLDVYKKAIKEEVTTQALLRGISIDTVSIQYRRITKGGARLTDYRFSYFFSQETFQISPKKIDFNVFAQKSPSSNIHIIIGRNGVGKSHLLNEMIKSLRDTSKDNKSVGSFILNDDDEEQFRNLVSVTFSAFDEYEFDTKEQNSNFQYQSIGLKNKKNELNSFSKQFITSLGLIISSSKIDRWKNAIAHLESDPIFENENFLELIDTYQNSSSSEIETKFSHLSSGHKIILLTITKLVEILQEKSLVFFDEPETHLHPPLLSSFIRAFSGLLSDRNAVCIMATHSPIILQEVPKNCVFKLTRIGHNATFERPKIETFGENVGVLTNEIFGLEVTKSGFYKVLKELVRTHNNYNDAVNSIDNNLGIEGRSILRSLFFNKKNENEILK